MTNNSMDQLCRMMLENASIIKNVQLSFYDSPIDRTTTPTATNTTSKPAKQAKAPKEEPVEQTETTEDFDLDFGSEEEPEAPKGPTKEDISKALNKLVKSKGAATAKKLLAKLNAKGISDLKEKDYQKIIDYVESNT